MKVALISMVKNECDIIELFLKINLRQLDHAYIFDHKSTDGTDLIIKKMINEGYPITYMYHQDDDFRQSDLITAATNQISKLGIYDYLVPLDADEFLATTDQFRSVKDAISVSLSTSSLGLIPWKTYCPISDF
jgi:glycosyltransferase involved in cell wall biosynthesis